MRGNFGECSATLNGSNFSEASTVIFLIAKGINYEINLIQTPYTFDHFNSCFFVNSLLATH